MAITKLTEDVKFHQYQDNEPNDVGGMTPEEFKEGCDSGVEKIKEYINDTLTVEIEAQFASKDQISNNRKLSDTGNFTGSWFGISSPEYAEPGQAAVVASHTAQLAENTQKFSEIDANIERIDNEKAAKTEVTNVMTPKGTISYASLPASGNTVGWYYYCPDGDGTHGAGNYTWNGTAWYFSGTGDEGYSTLSKDMNNMNTGYIVRKNNNNVISSPVGTPYACFFTKSIYIKSFKPYFNSSSGTFRILICETVDGLNIVEGTIIDGITDQTFNVGDTCEINKLITKSMCLVIIPSAGLSVKIIDGTSTFLDARIANFDISTNSVTNIPLLKDNYRFAGDFILRDYTKVLTVSQYGYGHYTTINDALLNVNKTEPTTILLKEGVYEEVLNLFNDYNLTIIGTSVDKCVIINKTGIRRNAPITVSGNFEIRNVTLKMTIENAPGVPTYDLSDFGGTYPGYAIHIDGDSTDPDAITYCRVKDCILYSEAFPAAGVGTNKNQHIIFEDCEFIRNCTDDNYKRDDWKGAMLAHCANGINQNLIIKRCIFRSNYGQAAYVRTDVGEPLNFTLTTIDNTFYSDENGVNSCTYSANGSLLHPMSHGNTATNLNAF